MARTGENAKAMRSAGVSAFFEDGEGAERAWALVVGELNRFVERCAPAARVAAALRERAGLRLVDVVDFVQLPRAEGLEAELRLAGYAKRALAGLPAGAEGFAHAGAGLPAVALAPGGVTRVGIGVERVEGFLGAWRVADARVEGETWATVRRARAFASRENELWAIERHGDRALSAPAPDAAKGALAAGHLEALRGRERRWEDPFRGFEHTARLVDAAIADVGRDFACDLFFRAERAWWESRCAAGRARRARQDSIGIGWGNHERHVYRTSRRCCADLVALLERLGCRCAAREHMNGGGGADRGVVTLEQAAAGVRVEVEVEVSEEEARGDFAHEPLASRREAGPVELWCALHGESALGAGLYALGVRGVVSAGMDVFTEMPGLKRAYEGEEEMWEVEEGRIGALVERGRLTREMAEEARGGGASGGRVEVVERG